MEDDNDFVNDENEEKFEINPSKHIRYVTGRAENGDFNEALEKVERHKLKVLKNQEEFSMGILLAL